MKYRRLIGYFQIEENPFSKNPQSIAKIMHEVLLKLNFLQTKAHGKIENINLFRFVLN